MQNKIRKYTLLASLLLHGLLFLFLILVPFGAVQVEPDLEEDPLVFEFVEPETQRPRQVIETPEDAKIQKPEKADYLSDKNALARNEQSNLPPSDTPFARGEVNSPELPTNRGPQGDNGQVGERDQKEEAASERNSDNRDQEYYAQSSASEFKRDFLVKEQTTTNPGVQNSSPRARYENEASNVPDFGSLSFNTYDWDFAPYMLDLKRRIERNIFPPPAFTRMGLISGETLLRFRIYPDGTMQLLEVLNYKGHETLMVTSRNAVEVSAPFLKLPSNFPKPYLEVTAKFSYSVERERR